jgi:D-alanyl-D-alanine carboxypeptidase (penicillin-binding protein 5/6)
VRVVGIVVALLVGVAIVPVAPAVSASSAVSAASSAASSAAAASAASADPVVADQTTAAGCAGQQAPPPPAAREETSTPSPLPWPAQPVGGPALGGCGEVGSRAPATVTAASYVLADLDTGAVLAARAPHARERPASTLKILTSLVVVDRLSPDTVIEGTAADLRVDGSKAGVGPGGRYTVRQLMAALLLSSGNDAAEAFARALGGDAATVTAMTATARQYGALDTRPATPSGLDGPGMASSAYDLAVLFRVALTKPLFSSTIATRMVAFPGYGDKPGFMLGNNDRFVPSYAGAIAAKSGFTDAARHTLVATAQRGSRRLIVALMRGEQHPVSMVAQAAALLDMGFATPPSSSAVGTLVDRSPPPPTSAPVAAPTAAAPPDAPNSTPWVAVVALVALVGAVVAALVRRRVRRR